MKKNHIKIVLILFFVKLQLLGSSYEWSVFVNKEKAYENEAIYLKYVCEFSDEAEVYAVEFPSLKSDENLTLKMLTQTTKIVQRKKRLTYELVAFVHKAQKMSFEFEVLMKKTSQDSIENTVIGRDNGKYAEYQTNKLKLEALEVEVLKAPNELVGDVSMSIKQDTKAIRALTPYHLEVKIEGEGNLQNIQELAFNVEGVKIFSEQPSKKFHLTKNGYRGEWSQKFAFVGEKDFQIDAFTIEYFNPKTASTEELVFKGTDVKLTQAYKKEQLLDSVEEKSSLFEWSYFYYFLSFLAGFLLSKIKFKKHKAKEEDLFCTKVKNAKSFDELSVLLIVNDEQKYKEIISQIQNKKLINLQKAKRLICA